MRRCTVPGLLTATMLASYFLRPRCSLRLSGPMVARPVLGEERRSSAMERAESFVAADSFGCAFRVGRTYRLASIGSDDEVYALAGRTVAYEVDATPVRRKIVVRSLGTERIVHQSSPNLGGAFGNASIAAKVILKRNGSVAWTYPNVTGEGAEVTGYELHTIGMSNRRVLLSRDADPESLRLEPGATTISWTEGGLTRTAAFE